MGISPDCVYHIHNVHRNQNLKKNQGFLQPYIYYERTIALLSNMSHSLMPECCILYTRVGILSMSFLWIMVVLNPSLIMLPNRLYRVPISTPLNNAISPYAILHVSFLIIVYTHASLILLTDIRFLVANLGAWRKIGRVLTLTSFSNY